MTNSVVILIHGLMRTANSMYKLSHHISENGYEVINYNYLSTNYSIQEHGTHLKDFVEQLKKENPNKTFHFVTHSLGGIIARDALAKLTSTQQCGSLIMLAPPNQGSALAKICSILLPRITKRIKPLAELSSDKNAAIHTIPTPNLKMGIIAGRFDAKVPPSFAQLKNYDTAFMIVNVAHTFIMNHPKAKKAIIQFLKHQTFN